MTPRLAAAIGLAGLLPGCSVRLFSTATDPITMNQCSAASDCGAGAQCSAGACFTTKGSLDHVLLEIVPEATSSSSGGLSFLYPQSGLSNGTRHLDVSVSHASVVATIQVDASSFPTGCTNLPSKSTSIEGVVEYVPAASNDFPIAGLSAAPISVNVARHPTDPSTNNPYGPVTLAPGTYDIYVQPKSPISCALPPRMLRGVEVAAKDADLSGPPGTLSMPAPLELRGKVTRNSPDPNETLAGWQVDLIEPQGGRVISTSAGWANTGPLQVSNFSIDYLPVAVASSNAATAAISASNGPILRMRPPDAMASRAPTVYWSLSAIDYDGDGVVNLDLSGVPTSSQLVSVSGHVLAGADGVPAALQFLSMSLDGTMGLTASFNQSVTADASGAYTTALFPGDYKIVAANSGAGGGSTTPSTWAITTQEVPVHAGSSLIHDVPLSPKRVVQGTAWAGAGSRPALGSIVQALPAIVPDRLDVWRGALAQTPIVPGAANVAVSPVDGSFTISLDPGIFDLTVEPADGSNFASWVWPQAQIGSSPLAPRLPFPVPIEGNLDDGTNPLPNALVRAYAKVPGGAAVTKVGDTRTDSNGHYVLLLPPDFGP